MYVEIFVPYFLSFAHCTRELKFTGLDPRLPYLNGRCVTRFIQCSDDRSFNSILLKPFIVLESVEWRSFHHPNFTRTISNAHL